MNKLTAEQVRSLLKYDPEIGLFTWRLSRGRVKDGDVAGCVDKVNGYLQISIGGKLYPAHRIAFLYMTGEWPDQCDHINHVRHDNRWCNLRDVSVQENHKNRTLSSTNTSGFIGVHWHKPSEKWQARIMVDGNRKSLGLFKNLTDAVSARRAASKEYGYHNNHGICKQTQTRS